MLDLDALQKLYDKQRGHQWKSPEHEFLCAGLVANFPFIVAHIKDLEAQLGEARSIPAKIVHLIGDACNAELVRNGASIAANNLCKLRSEAKDLTLSATLLKE